MLAIEKTTLMVYELISSQCSSRGVMISLNSSYMYRWQKRLHELQASLLLLVNNSKILNFLKIGKFNQINKLRKHTNEQPMFSKTAGTR